MVSARPDKGDEAGGAEKLADQLLRQIKFGSLLLLQNGRPARKYGRDNSGPAVTLTVKDPAFYGRVLRQGELGLGESYSEGLWDVEQNRVADFLSILLLNRLQPSLTGRFRVGLLATAHSLKHRPYLTNSRLNASFHYDLSNDFFRLFLDESMTYSCGLQKTPQDTLEKMQAQKRELICRKLELEPNDDFLDIGCGWGELVMVAAKAHGARCVGITQSAEQLNWAQSRVASAQLSDRIAIRLQDYREVEGTFSKIASVGMFEHVGKLYWALFVAKLRALLRPGGIGLLHTIGTTESRTPGPWLRRHIFPGTHLPRLEDLASAMRQHGLLVGHVENLRPHYAITAEKWHQNFAQNRNAISSLDKRFDESFLRGWDYYLQLLVASFRDGPLQLYQTVFCHRRSWSLPRVMAYHSDKGERPPSAIAS